MATLKIRFKIFKKQDSRMLTSHSLINTLDDICSRIQSGSKNIHRGRNSEIYKHKLM